MYELSTEVSTSSCVAQGRMFQPCHCVFHLCHCVTVCSICVTVSLCVPSVSLCHFVYRVVNVLCSALCAGLNYWCLALGALQMVLVHCSSILQEQVTM